jgi:hypothetical protein
MNQTILVAFAAVMAANCAALAASPNSVSFSADKKIVYANHAVRSYVPLPAHSPTHTTIFDNLATLDPQGVYMDGTGYTIGGPNSATGQIWLAAAFTPTANATVTEVDVAAGFVEGTKNSVVVGVYADASGIPGQLLWSGNAKLPTFGDCCAVATLTDKAGLPITAGTQYWVGITTPSTGTDTFAAWSFNVADQIDSGVSAENQGSGWVAGTSLPPVAFAVFGK